MNILEMAHSYLLSRIVNDPLKEDCNSVALQTLEKIIETSIGCHGKLKVIQNISGGHAIITSSFQRLLPIISLRNKFLKFIASSVKTHLNLFQDGGLSCTFLILRLINNALSLSLQLPIVGKIYKSFGEIYVNSLNAQNSSILIDISKISNLQSVLFSVMQSKPGCILTKRDIDYLSLLLLKIFLNVIPSFSETVCYKRESFITLEGVCVKESKIFEGLLIRYPETKIFSHFWQLKSIKIVLFQVSFSGDADFPVDKVKMISKLSLWEAVLKFLRNIVANIIENKVNIFACQKVIHPSLRKQLEDANVLVLDRLGYQTAKHLEYISGSSNSTLFSDISYGFLTCLSEEKVGNKNFLLLSNKSKSFWTLLICNFNEEAVNETKVVCEQSLNALYRLLKNPLVCYGAGCTEIYTRMLVEKKVVEQANEIKEKTGCTTSQLFESLSAFLRSISDLAVAYHQGSSLDFVTETVHGHLWKLRDGSFPTQTDQCMCGRFSAVTVSSSSWCFLSKTLNHIPCSLPFERIDSNIGINESLILDGLCCKTNAFSTAFETATLLLKTTACISNSV